MALTLTLPLAPALALALPLFLAPALSIAFPLVANLARALQGLHQIGGRDRSRPTTEQPFGGRDLSRPTTEQPFGGRRAGRDLSRPPIWPTINLVHVSCPASEIVIERRPRPKVWGSYKKVMGATLPFKTLPSSTKRSGQPQVEAL